MVILLPKLKEMIEKKFGESVHYSFQCYALQKSIEEATGELLSISTLKRIFGFATSNHLPRLSTLDILASYVGYPDYCSFEKDADVGRASSEFTEMEIVESENLVPGAIVNLIYSPGRGLTLKHNGDGWFEVVKVSGGKLEKGDMLNIRQIARNFSLIASEVIRNGKSLGTYVAAKQGGVKSIILK